MSIKINLIKNTGYNLGGYFYLLLASFFSISILLNNLGRDVFGVYIFLISFIPLAAVFDFGISNAVIRKLSLPNLDREERVKTWKTSYALFVALALILSVVVICLLLYLSQTLPIFAHLDKNILNWSVLLIALIVLVNHLDNHFLNLAQAEQRFDIFNTKTLLVGSANTIISAFISGIYPNIAFLFGSQLIFHLLTLTFMIRYSRKSFSGRDFAPAYDKQTGKGH
ncbi:MAG: O-antigen flippase [Candidatus Collierbacteria bacterium GW2011_GWB1_45_35]|nr:MAG: O-antigen flippase [Candidatus Collierbacteria bacterium GW2011_GWB1_45_35]